MAPETGHEGEEGLFDTLARRLRPGPRGRRWLGRGAAVLFVAVAVASWSRLPSVTLRWSWMWVVVAMLLISISLLAVEYRIAAWLVEKPVGWREAFRVTIFSSAANLLPVPGGLAVRTGALQRKGSGWTRAIGSNVVMGLGWLGVALLLAGGLLHGEAPPVVAGGFFVAGVAVLAVMTVAIGRIRDEGVALRSVGRVLGLEGAYVLASAVRLYAVLAGLGLQVTFGQATALTVASALAAGVGFFPGGLGLRELVAGALSPLVGLAPAVGAFAGVVDRIVGLVLRALVAGILWKSGSRADRLPPGRRD